VPIPRILIGEDDQHDHIGIFIHIRDKILDRIRIAKKIKPVSCSRMFRTCRIEKKL
jgi:hypothetical protein